MTEAPLIVVYRLDGASWIGAKSMPTRIHIAKPRALAIRNSADLLAAYNSGERDFHNLDLRGVKLSNADLTGASFLGADLRGSNFSHSLLTYTQFKGADVSGASFRGSWLNATDLIGANFGEADLASTDLTGASLHRANLARANLNDATLGNAVLGCANLDGATFLGTRLFGTHLADLDVRALCDATHLVHGGPSDLDYRTVCKSYLHPKLKQFMLDCGVPEIFAEFMIDCARAMDTKLIKSVMQSTFISYGGPDEAFARKLYEALRAHGVVTFFFPETATVGDRISGEIFRRIQEHDRILLICSRGSLDRAGVLNEIQETLNREARDGGATYLLPIMLDDYVLKDWKATHPTLAERTTQRVIADFRGARRNRQKFDAAMARVIDALKKKRPAT